MWEERTDAQTLPSPGSSYYLDSVLLPMGPSTPENLLAILPLLATIPNLDVRPIFADSYEIIFALPTDHLGTCFISELGELGNEVKDVLAYTRKE